MAEQPTAQLAEHADGVDVELLLPWERPTSPVASCRIEPDAARALATRLFVVALQVETRRATLGIPS